VMSAYYGRCKGKVGVVSGSHAVSKSMRSCLPSLRTSLAGSLCRRSSDVFCVACTRLASAARREMSSMRRSSSLSLRYSATPPSQIFASCALSRWCTVLPATLYVHPKYGPCRFLGSLAQGHVARPHWISDVLGHLESR